MNLQWIFFAYPTFAEQDVVGQGEEGWHGAIQGWLQYSLGIVHGCLHSSSIRHSPLWHILLHLCIPHFNIWLQRSPQEMSVRWQGILLRSWKRGVKRWQLKMKNYKHISQSTFTVNTSIWHCPRKNSNTKISWDKNWVFLYIIVQYSNWSECVWQKRYTFLI